MLNMNADLGDESDAGDASDDITTDYVTEDEIEKEPISEDVETTEANDSESPEPEIAEDNGDAMLAIALMEASEEPEPNLATIHPRDNPETIETLPNPEKEPIATITLEAEPEIEEEPAEPPKDWTPGGPERG
jgi:hypothetical protein